MFLLILFQGYGGQTALHKAVYIGNYSVSLTLLKNGADPNFANETGKWFNIVFKFLI